MIVLGWSLPRFPPLLVQNKAEHATRNKPTGNFLEQMGGGTLPSLFTEVSGEEDWQSVTRGAHGLSPLVLAVHVAAHRWPSNPGTPTQAYSSNGIAFVPSVGTWCVYDEFWFKQEREERWSLPSRRIHGLSRPVVPVVFDISSRYPQSLGVARLY